MDAVDLIEDEDGSGVRFVPENLSFAGFLIQCDDGGGRAWTTLSAVWTRIGKFACCGNGCRRPEQALALTRHSLECASDGVFWLDSSGRYVYANEAATRLTGWPHEELLSMRAYELVPGRTPELWSSRWAEVKRRGANGL